MSTKVPYSETGRRRQKARTRDALIEAARALVKEGATPTVEEAARAASISRATAYRYFPNRQALLVAAHPEVEEASLLGPDPPVDPEERLDRVIERLATIFLDSETSYRTMLRLSLEEDPETRGDLSLRKGRRYLWIEEALEPLRDRIPRSRWELLVHGISVAIGIEALVTLVDLAGLPRARAVEVMRWSARALLRTALDETPET